MKGDQACLFTRRDVEPEDLNNEIMDDFLSAMGEVSQLLHTFEPAVESGLKYQAKRRSNKVSNITLLLLLAYLMEDECTL